MPSECTTARHYTLQSMENAQSIVTHEVLHYQLHTVATLDPHLIRLNILQTFA